MKFGNPAKFVMLYAIVLLTARCQVASSAEVIELDAENWERAAPRGKEVDAIYGDHVLRNDRLIAVIAKAADTRHANMTVQHVGGTLIDFTLRDEPSDQLSALYPHGVDYKLSGPVDWPKQLSSKNGSAKIAFQAHARRKDENATQPEMVVGYELSDGADFLTVKTLLMNPHDAPLEVRLADAVRADGEFKFGHEAELNLWWCQDEYWRQAYGIMPVGEGWLVKSGNDERLRVVPYQSSGGDVLVIPPGEQVVFERRLIAAANTATLQAAARELAGQRLQAVTLSIADPSGAVPEARVRIEQEGKSLGIANADGEGRLALRLPAGTYQIRVEALGRPERNAEIQVTDASNDFAIEFAAAPGRVEGAITDDAGAPVPCKIAFRGQGVSDPDFGPDSAVHGVRNLWYTHDGTFGVELLPGEYEVLVSRGPEYDAVTKTLHVREGETTRLDAKLVRSVDTSGWLSAELHSHSSPSGDNTASQRGRVLNLLAEHLEFIPCTEHQRISTYEPHLAHFGASQLVLTCSGMELTGQPLPINHQNAFPLIRREGVQDGGGPVTDVNPEVQIARLAMWDDQSDKVVQINHPNIGQMIGDRDLDGTPDQGFRKMFHFADVMEVHPTELVFTSTAEDATWRNRPTPVIAWMQMLNLGYRIPGVINTDAHWNFHGSGWRRNYVRSRTDDPSKAELMELCHALEKGHVVMTNGPFLEVEATSGDATVGPGEDLDSGGRVVELTMRVQCPNWLDINRVQVFVNGRPLKHLNYTRRTHQEMFGQGIVKFEQTIPLSLDGDAHLIVAAAGEGLQLGHVYGPQHGDVMPIALSNPIFVDHDGDGFIANRDLLGFPLPVEADHEPTHGHRHVHPHTHTHPHPHSHSHEHRHD